MAKKSCSINAIQLRLIKEKVVKGDFTIKVLLICCKRFRRTLQGIVATSSVVTRRIPR